MVHVETVGCALRSVTHPTKLGLTQVSQQKYKLMFVVSALCAYYKHNDCASYVSPVNDLCSQDARLL
jgi:hypothetical protein